MANELGLYQLFKNIFAISTVIEGRFHVLADKQDIDSTNFAEIIKDALDGLKVEKKYPCVVMLAPTESEQVNDKGWSTYHCKLYFCTLYRRTGDGGIKTPDIQLNISEHTKEMDWKDMREVAGNFRKILRSLIGRPPVCNSIREGSNVSLYSRLTSKGSDNINGIAVSFDVDVFNNYCAYSDYPDNPVVEIPDFNNIHPLHKQ